jgi:hypothetical protein
MVPSLINNHTWTRVKELQLKQGNATRALQGNKKHCKIRENFMIALQEGKFLFRPSN